MTNRGTYPDGKLPGQPIQTHLLLAKTTFLLCSKVLVSQLMDKFIKNFLQLNFFPISYLLKRHVVHKLL